MPNRQQVKILTFLIFSMVSITLKLPVLNVQWEEIEKKTRVIFLYYYDYHHNFIYNTDGYVYTKV